MNNALNNQRQALPSPQMANDIRRDIAPQGQAAAFDRQIQAPVQQAQRLIDNSQASFLGWQTPGSLRVDDLVGQLQQQVQTALGNGDLDGLAELTSAVFDALDGQSRQRQRLAVGLITALDDAELQALAESPAARQLLADLKDQVGDQDLNLRQYRAHGRVASALGDVQAGAQLDNVNGFFQPGGFADVDVYDALDNSLLADDLRLTMAQRSSSWSTINLRDEYLNHSSTFQGQLNALANALDKRQNLDAERYEQILELRNHGLEFSEDFFKNHIAQFEARHGNQYRAAKEQASDARAALAERLPEMAQQYDAYLAGREVLGFGGGSGISQVPDLLRQGVDAMAESGDPDHNHLALDAAAQALAHPERAYGHALDDEHVASTVGKAASRLLAQHQDRGRSSAETATALAADLAPLMEGIANPDTALARGLNQVKTRLEHFAEEGVGDRDQLNQLLETTGHPALDEAMGPVWTMLALTKVDPEDPLYRELGTLLGDASRGGWYLQKGIEATRMVLEHTGGDKVARIDDALSRSDDVIGKYGNRLGLASNLFGLYDNYTKSQADDGSWVDRAAMGINVVAIGAILAQSANASWGGPLGWAAFAASLGLETYRAHREQRATDAEQLEILQTYEPQLTERYAQLFDGEAPDPQQLDALFQSLAEINISNPHEDLESLHNTSPEALLWTQQRIAELLGPNHNPQGVAPSVVGLASHLGPEQTLDLFQVIHGQYGEDGVDYLAYFLRAKGASHLQSVDGDLDLLMNVGVELQRLEQTIVQQAHLSLPTQDLDALGERMAILRQLGGVIAPELDPGLRDALLQSH